LIDEVREMPTKIIFEKQLHDQLLKDAHDKPFDLLEEDAHDLGLVCMPPKL